MKHTATFFTAAFIGFAALSMPAQAKVSCWSTWDPIACWLQEAFGNGNTQLARPIALPNPKSETYKKGLMAARKAGFGSRKLRKYEGPDSVKQVCKPEELLRVAAKTGSVMKTAKTCFK